MSQTFNRAYSNAPGFEGQDLWVEFEVYSWGSPMTREHPGDPFEFSVTVCYVDDDTMLPPEVLPEFFPLKELEDWLTDQFTADPPEFYYDDGYDERER